MFRNGTTLLLAVFAAACGQPGKLDAHDAYVRLAAVEGRPAAAYFTLTGGASDQVLVRVTTPAAVRAELHESRMAAGGGMTMDALPEVRVPAGGDVAFAPAGKHVMLFDVNPTVRPGAEIPLTFGFADGTEVTAEARVVAAGDAVP